MIIIKGTKTFISLSKTKFCNHWVQSAPSADSKWSLIDSILVLRARSNLSALTISKVHDHTSLFVSTLGIHATRVLSLHSTVFTHNAWVKIGKSEIFVHIFVHGLMANWVSNLEVYTVIFFSFQVQDKNHAGTLFLFTKVSHLFWKRIVIFGRDHWERRLLLRAGDSLIAISTPATSWLRFWHCVEVYL